MKSNSDDRLQLSYAQQRQWFIWQLDPASSTYHIPTALRLQGGLDLVALQLSFDALVARHETLRTTFVSMDGHARQVIHEVLPLPIERAVLSSHADDAEKPRDQRIRAWIEAAIARPFDLTRGPLLGVHLLSLADDDHVLVLVQHHIVSDGWSMSILVRELIQLYVGYGEERTVRLPDLPIQYADYAAWQRGWMAGGEKERQLSYWTNQLGGEQPVLELPLDRPRPMTQSHRGARLEQSLSPELGTALKRLAKQESATLFMVLLASFQALLYRYSGQTDIRVGVPIANRNRLETERLIGFFVNTQVLRAEIDPRQSFLDLLRQVKKRALEAQAHQDLPFEQIVEVLRPERSLGRSPLFQMMYNHQRAVRGERRALGGLVMETLSWEARAALFDLTLDTVEHADRIDTAFTYATDLFDRTSIERLARHWVVLLEAVARQAAQSIAELPLLNAAERYQQLVAWNHSPAKPWAERCVNGLFEAQVAKASSSVALIVGDNELTYAQLNARSNRLAHLLSERGVRPGARVAVMTDRPLAGAIGMLAVLKASAAYVSAGSDCVEDELPGLFKKEGVEWLLVEGRDVSQFDIAHVRLDGLDLLNGPSDDLKAGVQVQNLFCLLYSSAVRGIPRSVNISHGEMSDRVQAMRRRYNVVPTDRLLHYGHEWGSGHWLLPLISGAALVLTDGGTWDSAEVAAAIEKYRITMAYLPASLADQCVARMHCDKNENETEPSQRHGGGIAMLSVDGAGIAEANRVDAGIDRGVRL